MERWRSFLGSGCWLAAVLSLAALLVACALGGVLLWQAAVPPIPAPVLSPVRTPVFALSPLRPLAVPLHVVDVTPSDGSEDVETRAVVKVTFNQPMVDLQADPGPAELPPPFAIRPPVEGLGRWIAADTYQFRPRALNPATCYTITVPAGTASLGGATLAADHTVTFSTVRPTVRRTQPRADATSVDPGGEVHVVFSMPMDRRSAESRFGLVNAQGRRIEGAFHWPSSEEMVFVPDALLARSGLYRATLAAGARAAGRELGTSTDHAFGFIVVEPPHIVGSAPADGDLAARPAGQLTIRFNVPMDSTSVEAALQIEPEPEYVDLQWSSDGTRLEAYVDFDPSAEYRVLVGEGARDRYDQPLTGNRSIVFRSAPLEPMLSLYGPAGYYQGAVGSYVADQAVEQFVEVRNLEEVTFRLSAVEPSDFVAAYRDRYQVPDPQAIEHARLRTWTRSLDLPLNRIKYVSTTVAGPGGRLDPGVYLLEVYARRLRDARFMVVSRANLALKWGPRQVFVWATDVISSQVIPGMRIAVYGRDGNVLAEGLTGDDGVFVADVADVSAGGGEYWQRWEQTLFVVGESPGENDLALCTSSWDEGITVWDFNLPLDRGETGSSVAYVYSDRPIYRPGQTVHFKGIVRADDDGRYALLDTQVVTIPVSIEDSQGNELFSGDLPLTEFGTIHGELQLAETAPLGRYTVHANLPGRGEPQRMYFTVSEYRKPEFEVAVSAETRNLVSYATHGEVITVTVHADYYFGQPVPDAPVRWRLQGSPYWFSLPGVWYNFGEYTGDWWTYGQEQSGDGQMVYASGEGRTDENGQFVIRIPVDLGQSKVSQVLSIEASLVDANDQEVTGRAVVLAHKTDTYLGVRPHRYVGAPAVAQQIDLVALDPLKQPRGGITVTVEFYRHRWDTVREKTDAGGYVWRNELTEELLASQVVTTAVDGTARASVTPPAGGEYEVVARTVDGLGNEGVSSTYLWVWGGGYVNWGVHNNNRIHLVADKREYEPGEVAEILVTAPFSGCLALVTVERGGVLSHDVRRLEGTSALLEVPIVADYAPNVFVSVSLLKGQEDGDSLPAPMFRLGYVELRVTRREQQLNVAITPDKERYQPGDTATYTIRTTDYRGRGVPVELSVGVVDAAVLALLGDNAAPILDAFYYRRPIGVWNAQTLVISVERLNEVLESRGKGGGGGGEEEDLTVRRSFLDTAYWDPVVVTGWDGRAVVRVPLPDDLTTWRLRAKAVTLDTRVGDGSADVISTKDLLVRPVLPRFFSVGDEATLAALVHNYTDVTRTVQVDVQVEGLQVTSMQGASGQGASVQGAGGQGAEATLVIAPGAAEKVSWAVTVLKGREAKVLFVARAAGAALADAALADAVEKTLPVHAFAETTTLAANERVRADERLAVAVELPYDVDEMDELVIETAPSLGAGIRTGLEYLTGYPYG
jgi:uncharacterized protein YfaS (alpha-2-macroglobulin family)